MSMERQSVPVAARARSQDRPPGVRVAAGVSDTEIEAIGWEASGPFSLPATGQIIQLDPELLDQVLARLKMASSVVDRQRLEAIKPLDSWPTRIFAASILLEEDLSEAFQSVLGASERSVSPGAELAPLLPVRLEVTVVQKNWITASAFTARTSTRESWRIVVNREMVLTGNRSYLVRRHLVVVGLVRSVDRKEVEAAAILAKGR